MSRSPTSPSVRVIGSSQVAEARSRGSISSISLADFAGSPGTLRSQWLSALAGGRRARRLARLEELSRRTARRNAPGSRWFPERKVDRRAAREKRRDVGLNHRRSSSTSSIQSPSSVSTVSNPRRANSARAVDLPTPDIPVTRTAVIAKVCQPRMRCPLGRARPVDGQRMSGGAAEGRMRREGRR